MVRDCSCNRYSGRSRGEQRYSRGSMGRVRNGSRVGRVRGVVRRIVAACSDEDRPAGVICGIIACLFGLLVIFYGGPIIASACGVQW